MTIASRGTVLTTPWFEVIAKDIRGREAEGPYYALRMSDYVTVLALTVDHRVVLVRQYRPAVERETLELPSGHVEPGESPIECGLRELREETGYIPGRAESLGRYLSDTGRHENGIWYVLVRDAVRDASAAVTEADIRCECVPLRQLPDLMTEGKLDHALNLAVFAAALRRAPELFDQWRVSDGRI